MLTAVGCDIFNSNLPERETSAATEYVVVDVPEYFEDLIKLDKFFKDHSLEGFDEDKMAEAILDDYAAATGDICEEYREAEG